MMKNYILLLLLLPFLTFAQSIEFESSTIADLSAYSTATNFAGLGEYEIFLDTDTGVLDKPIILLDGFDPGDVRTISGLYSLLDFSGSEGNQNLADLVRAEGYDVVILNFPQYLRLADNSLLNIDNVEDTNADMIIDETDFPEGSELIDGGADFMERNAMLLVELINTLNADKVGEEELVIIGPSMGGLISRFALNFMENESIDHETRLWISFDAPHLGANVPLGFQHQFNYLANGLGDDLNVELLQPVVEGLMKSPAARQLLTDHFETHLVAGNDVEFDPTKLLPEAHPFRVIFDSSIKSLTSSGFPENTRNVSIINGSGIGAPYQAIDGTDVIPGFAALTIEDLSLPDAGPVTNITANININLTPTTSDGVSGISSINVEGFFIFPLSLVNVQASAQAPSYTDGIDAASGGLFDILSFTDGVGEGGIFGDFNENLNLDKFSFIPSVSGMALNFPDDEIDWYSDINLPSDGGSNSMTPFVNWYMPDENQSHVQLTDANVAFALSEIYQDALSNPSFQNLRTIQLAKNPIENDLIILSEALMDGVCISISDLTGKSVFRSEILALQNRHTIPLNLQSGLYILNIKSAGALKFRGKLLVR